MISLKALTLDKSGANYAGLEHINILLIFAGLIRFVKIMQVKYLNNLIEQDHRFFKKVTQPMMGFKAFHSASSARIVSARFPRLRTLLGRKGWKAGSPCLWSYHFQAQGLKGP